jgi:hypothetical protein
MLLSHYHRRIERYTVHTYIIITFLSIQFSLASFSHAVIIYVYKLEMTPFFTSGDSTLKSLLPHRQRKPP